MAAITPAPSGGLSEPKWQVARFCNGGACVQVAPEGSNVLIGDSKNPNGPVLTYSRDEWQTFVEGVRQGDFDDLF